MHDPSEDPIETWIAERKNAPSVDLCFDVMREIRGESRVAAPKNVLSRPPAWALAFGCLLAGAGKLGLVIHFAF